MDDHIVKRRILEVFDKKEGVIINAEEFFNRPENEIVRWRRIFEESLEFGEKRFLCPACLQPVKIAGRKFMRGKVSFFSHLHDSEFCEIKTNTELTKSQIEARKYGLVGESERHHRLKGLISRALNSDVSKKKGVNDVAVEKRINSYIPGLNWRRPDVMATFNSRNIVFELQLSTTFISVVVQRDIFYRLNNYFIIWVFNFEENAQYVDLTNLMCKDIYYANKRNVFIFDEEAQRASVEKDELVLKCNWLDVDSTWHYSKDKGNGDGILITLDQLHLDEETNKPFFFDAETPYFNAHPEVRERLRREEQDDRDYLLRLKEKEEREQLEARMKEEARLAALDKARAEMTEKDEVASIFCENGKYGLIYDPLGNHGEFGRAYGGIVFAEPIYSYIHQTGSSNKASDAMFDVSISNRNGRIFKHGLLDRFGGEIFPCKYDRFCFIGSLILGEGDGKFETSHGLMVWPKDDFDYISFERISDDVSQLTAVKAPLGTPDKIVHLPSYIIRDSRLLIKCDECSWRFTSLQGDFIDDRIYSYCKAIVDGLFVLSVEENGSYFLADVDGTPLNEKTYNSITLVGNLIKAVSEGCIDIYDFSGEYVKTIPYDDVKLFGHLDLYKVEKNGCYGLLDKNLDEVIPVKYSKFFWTDRIWAGKKTDGESWDLWDMDLHLLGTLACDEISVYTVFDGNFSDRWYLKIVADKSIGLLDENCRWILKPLYQKIESYPDFYIVRFHDGSCGLCNRDGSSDECCRFDCIEPFREESTCRDDVVRCFVGDKAGVYSREKHELCVPCAYQNVWPWHDMVYKVQEEDKFGLYKGWTGLLTEIKYEEIGEYSEEEARAVATLNENKGHIDVQGKEIISEEKVLNDQSIARLFFGQWTLTEADGTPLFKESPLRKEVEPIAYIGHGLYKVKNAKGLVGVYDKRGYCILYSSFRDVESEPNTPYLIAKVIKKPEVRGKWTTYKESNAYRLYYIDGTKTGIPKEFKKDFSRMSFACQGVLLIKDHLVSTKDFTQSEEEYCACKPYGKYGFLLVRKYGLGLLSQDFKTIIPCKCESIADWGNGLLLVRHCTQSDPYCLYHKDGKICDIGEFTSISDLIEGKALITKNGKEGYIDADGQFKFDSTRTLANGIIEGSAFGYVELRDETNGDVLLPLTESVTALTEFLPDCYKAEKKEGFAFFYPSEKRYVNRVFKFVEPWPDKNGTGFLATDATSLHLTLFNECGRQMLDNDTEYLQLLRPGVFSARKDGLVSLYKTDMKTATVFSKEYEKIFVWGDYYIAGEYRYDVINEKGDVVLNDLIFWDLHNGRDLLYGRAKVSKADKTYFINNKLEKIADHLECHGRWAVGSMEGQADQLYYNDQVVVEDLANYNYDGNDVIVWRKGDPKYYYVFYSINEKGYAYEFKPRVNKAKKSTKHKGNPPKKKDLPNPFQIDEIVEGTICEIKPFGIRFVTADHRRSLIHITLLKNQHLELSQFSKSQKITVQKTGINTEHKNDIWKILKIDGQTF